MIYNKIFKEKDRLELTELLENHQTMNFDAKKALLELVQTKEYLLKHHGQLIKELQQDVMAEEEVIASFTYLKYLGLRLEKSIDGIRITRLSRFILVDAIGILIGTILASLIYFAIDGWRDIIFEGLSILPLITSIIITIISLVGLTLMVRSLFRLVDLSGFEIIKNEAGLRIKKRSELFIESVLVNESKLDLIEMENGLSMVYLNDAGKTINVITAKGGVKVRETLVYLKNLLAQ